MNNACSLATFHIPGAHKGQNKNVQENYGRVKGQPPFMRKPELPLTLAPNKVNPVAIMDGVNGESKANQHKMLNCELTKLALAEDGT